METILSNPNGDNKAITGEQPHDRKIVTQTYSVQIGELPFEFSVSTRHASQESWIYGNNINEGVRKQIFIKCAPNPLCQGRYFVVLCRESRNDEGEDQAKDKKKDDKNTYLTYQEDQEERDEQDCIGNILEETEEGLNEPNNEIHNDPNTEGPPPGFSGPPRFAVVIKRRSRRLSTKYSGVYISPEERARRVTKPDSAPIPQGGPKKKGAVCQA